MFYCFLQQLLFQSSMLLSCLILIITTALGEEGISSNFISGAKVVPFRNHQYSCFAILNTRQDSTSIALGKDDGVIQIVDLQKNQLIKKTNKLTHKVRQIVAYGQDGHFIGRDLKKAIHFNHQGSIFQEWSPQKFYKGMAVVQNTTGSMFISFVYYKKVTEHFFTNNQSYINSHYDLFAVPADFAVYSPSHQYFYLINQKQTQLVVYNIDDKPMGGNDNQKSSQIEKQQKRREITLERKFNFKIKQLLTDNKDRYFSDPDGLMMVTQDGQVYNTKRGTIVTYLPYQQSAQGNIIASTFCERKYFLTLHSSNQQGQNLHFLTFFNKKTWKTQEVIILNKIHEGIDDVMSMDCNQRKVVIMTKMYLLVLDVEYSDEEYYGSFEFSIEHWQIIFSILLFYGFIRCCRGKGDNYEDSEQSQEEEIQESQMIEDEQNIKNQDAQRQNTDTSQSRVSKIAKHHLNTESKQTTQTKQPKSKRKYKLKFQ